MYQHLDAALLRAATHRADAVPAWPDLTPNPPDDAPRWRSWLTSMWSPQIAEAIELASSTLADEVSAICDRPGGEDPSKVRGAVVSMTRYLLRMTARATPFGLFAGICPTRIEGATTKVCWGQDHTAVARPDAGWLTAVVARLESCAAVQDRLMVATNDLCFLRGDRLVVPYQPQRDDAPAEVSVRHTRAVATAVRLANNRCGFAQLLAELAAEFPDRDAQLRDMLTELLRHRILLSDLRPPMSAPDPLGHILTRLRRMHAETIPELTPTPRALHELHADLHRYARAADSATRAPIHASAIARMADITPSDATRLAVDLRLDCSATLPLVVAQRAESAAEQLTRLDPTPYGEPAWRDYHSRFLERYGPDAVVPIRDLVSDASLGYPAGYRGTRYQPPGPTLTDRDHRLLALAQTAAITGANEVVLDEQTLAALQVTDPTTVQVAPHTELGFQVHAASRDAVDRGDFDLVVTAAFRAAGTTAGRFHHLLTPAERHRSAAAYRSLPTIDPDADLVQLSCPPALPRTENLARATPLLALHMSLGESSPPGLRDVNIRDLAVTADARRLQLISLHTQRPIEVTAMNSVEFANATQPLARFLLEISRSRTATCRPFSWGAAAKLPFLPRLRHGRTVLSVARWNLTPADVAAKNAPWARWADTFTAWSHPVRLPDAVYVGGDDRRLRLDLREPTHLRLLRAHLERHRHATLREAPDPAAFGWLDGRTHEIVLPLVSTAPPVWPALRSATPQSPRLVRSGDLPGRGRVLQAKLYGHPDRQNNILTNQLDDHLSAGDERAAWWFLRYRDPDPHIRLRIPLPDKRAYGRMAERLSEWATGLRDAGLISDMVLTAYQPETGRFGTGPAMAAAEAVFAADSRAAVAQLAAAPRGPDLTAVTAASMVDLAIGMTGGIPEGMHWLIDHVRRRSTSPLPRTTQQTAARLAEPDSDWKAVRNHAGNAIADAWAARRLTLAIYRAHLHRAGEIEPDVVLASLLHLHYVRVFGIDPNGEDLVHRLSRSIAVSWIARTERSHP